MKKNIIKLIIACFVILIGVGLSACQDNQKTEDENTKNNPETVKNESVPNNTESIKDLTDWQSVLQTAKGTTVRFYGWGGDQKINSWIDNSLSPYVKANYGLSVERVPMDIDVILNKLNGEKAANQKQGSIDVIWINGENFASAKEQGLLLEKMTSYLPNYKKYISETDSEATSDFGTEIEGLESPYGKAQFTLIGDSAKVNELPTSSQELLEYCKANPGKFTYPSLPDFTGSAFVRNLIYDIVGYQNIKNLPNDKEKVRKVIMPAMNYLKELKPYLWQKGEAYPATLAELDQMFQDGIINFSMNYDPLSTSAKIISGVYPETTQVFVFDKGSVGNTNYLAIAKNSSNVEGALCLIDAVLSVEMQASKMDPRLWGSLPVLSMDKLNDDEKLTFKNIDLSDSKLDIDDLLSKRLAEPPSYLIPIIEEIWLEEIAK